jgi:hypothetical protein
MPKGFQVDHDSVKGIADDVSGIGEAFAKAQAYAKQSGLSKKDFGLVRGLSAQAGVYVDKYLQLADSIGKAQKSMTDYSGALINGIKAYKETDAEVQSRLGGKNKAADTPTNANTPTRDLVAEKLKDPAGPNNSENSTTIFQELEPFHDLLGAPALDLYSRWISHPSRNLQRTFQDPLGCGVGATIEGNNTTGQSASSKLDQLCNFALGYFFAAGNRADNLGEAGKAAYDAEGQAKKKLLASWDGAAAEAAADRLNELANQANKYSETAHGFGAALHKLFETIRQPILDVVTSTKGGVQSGSVVAVQSGADTFRKQGYDESYYSGQSMFIDRLDEAIQWGRQKNTGNQFLTHFDAYVDPRSANEVARSADSGTGPIAPQALRGMSVDLDTGYDSKWSDMFCQDMDFFALNYSTAIGQYRDQINKTYDVVCQALQAFIDVIGTLGPDPFKVNAPADGTDGNAGSGSSVGGTKSVSTPSSPAMTAPAADIPAMPTPAAPEMPPAPTQPDAAAPVVINPITHAAAEIDPSTGRPYPIDPQTGIPIKADQSTVDTMSAKQGNDTIAMSEPGEDGKMMVSVDDGSGKLRSYQLDFGNGRVDGNQAGVAQQVSNSGSVEGQPLSALQAQLSPQPVSVPPAALDHSFTAQPDGTIHVDDGNLKIVAERADGPNGATTVTIDNGSGQPATYTLTPHADPSTLDASNPAFHTGQGIPDHPQAIPESQPVPSHGAAAVDAQSTVDNNAVLANQPVQASHSLSTEGPTAQPDLPAAPVQSTSLASVDSAHDFTSPSPVAEHASNHLADLGDTSYLDAGQNGVSAQKAHDDSSAELVGLGSAPVGHDQSSVDPSGGMGGMGMMGGMMGGAGGHGGDQERGSNVYQDPSSLFSVGEAVNRISGSLDDEDHTSYEYGRYNG